MDNIAVRKQDFSASSSDSGIDAKEHNYDKPISYDPPRSELLDRRTIEKDFSTEAYLNDFYSTVDDCAMQMVLCYLPQFAARIGKKKRLLDFGAGPTIHVPCCFRNYVDEFFLADYLPQNRNELMNWYNKTSKFNWSKPLKMIVNSEMGDLTKLGEIENLSRSKIKAIIHCDAFKDPSINCHPCYRKTFDIITSLFCLEYCTETNEEFKKCINNVLKQLKPGGYYIMGGVMEETWCSFNNKKFLCLYLTEKVLFDALREAGMDVDNEKETIFINNNGMYMILSKKKST
ncbi:Methyltransferase, NNMT/PNMT/TEMT family and Putative NNMT/PNMT/TEMT methyltransferase, nematoda family-containing protein [Strongyloides ratti]|uniref:Methyltransferase, NNMT/PNMT/TEMT family and Putative NNMT/PNMT/TEMT methyltransferase, nematoda family-containing protein n=1 Tax=Strongyloides ratti TaxID=34506 RepID=A0A090LGC3_STRRB|nr:Methyltransferase, NNMT/PNMT/TEMT family and Putative NNMT/PNMT/TEMT methyltransferase, nematoda family-containing protein [Strongyloides ratti]CEF68851.1 Methyltransferase, NNMT/PNMT/TEMT family and Putative NNMT/PNMT/TEMT methyltransferase, nematoda family-containing protein [Strongyloides ratti]